VATNFLQATGGSTTGYFVSAVTLISTEIVSLASSGTATSATIYTSSASFGQAIWGEAWVYWGGAITPAAGGFISCWFIRSGDGGTNFEVTPTSAPLARSPDFTIPLSTIAYASSNEGYATGIVKMPWAPSKLFVQNNAGTAFPSSATQYSKIVLGPVAVQY